jgi:hypothetical protein
VGDLPAPGLLNQIDKSNQIAFDIQVGILYRIPHSSLGGKMQDGTELFFAENPFQALSVGHVCMDKLECLALPEQLKPSFLQASVIKRIQVIQAEYVKAGLQ